MNCGSTRRSLLPLLLAAIGCLLCLGALAGFKPAWNAIERNNIREKAVVISEEAVVDRQDGKRLHNGSACTPRSVEAFPPDAFTLEQKRHGAILIHVFACAWLFVALAIVCDDYFVASLEVVSEALHLKPDVAGATFMAAGNSSTQLVTAVIGVFLAESDVGVSTIVGSAIFNNLMIVSLCGLAAAQFVRLSCWPLFRDCGFYAFSVAVLVGIIHDGLVTWYESVFLIILLIAYVTVMVFNNRLDKLVHRCLPRLAAWEAVKKTPVMKSRSGAVVGGSEDVEGKREVGGLPQMMEIWSVEMNGVGGDGGGVDGGLCEDAPEVLSGRRPQPLFAAPQGLLKRAYWLLTLPWAAAFRLTIPDCRRPGVWRRLFILTFLASVMWISGMVYLLVWMVCAIGDAMGIPDTVMGLTLLAVGTCIPDAMAGIFVAKTGLGDMAIANALASNVFDITACLGLPWFIRTVVLRPGSSVVIRSSGLTYTSLSLLSTVLFLLVAVCLNRMRMDKKLGVIFLVAYLTIVTLACLYETNTFGEFNPAPCPRLRP